MSPEIREKLRKDILLVLETNFTRYGHSLLKIAVALVEKGFEDIGAAELDKELAYLEGAGLVEQASKSISPENRAWRITKAGRDHVAQLGL